MTAILALLLFADLIPAGHPVVLLFIRTDCPISNRYAPTVKQLYETFSARGIEFRLVYPEPGVSQEAINRHRTEYGYAMPGVPDADRRYVRETGVTITPEAAVFLKGRLVYRGRIDDRFASVSQTRPKPTSNDLEIVLQAIASGQNPAPRVTKAIGCAIEPAP
jgi:hypothetical protein